MFHLRPFQAMALERLRAPGHLICVSPTGSGKSLIYEKAAGFPETRMLLVTPLIALARQQHERFTQLGIEFSRCIGDSKDPPPVTRSGAWIVSPEAIQSPGRLRSLRRFKPNLLVVDECHCLWEWGESFRPAFETLPPLIRTLGIERSLWLTATLPADARAQLKSSLPSPCHEIGRFALPSGLHLRVLRVDWTQRSEALLDWLSFRREPGVVFVPTRELTLRLTKLIEASGRKCLPYHAGLSDEERRLAESRIARRETDVVVATSAFGMGVHYPHLRWVALWQAPASPLSLAQAIGRAGRSEDPGHALVMWDSEDFRLLEWMTQDSERKKADLQACAGFLNSTGCREARMREYFEINSIDARCGRCDRCLNF